MAKIKIKKIKITREVHTEEVPDGTEDVDVYRKITIVPAIQQSETEAEITREEIESQIGVLQKRKKEINDEIDYLTEMLEKFDEIDTQEATKERPVISSELDDDKV